MRHSVMIGVVLLLAGIARAGTAAPGVKTGEPHYIGYHGPDGTQFYPKSNPPTEWDGQSGKNVLWQTPLPYMSYGGVLAVKDRVFVMSEFGYKSDFPELVCVDALTGKILWKKEINHLALAVPDEAARKKVSESWHNHLTWRREYLTLRAELGGAKDPAAKAAVEEKMKAKGMFTADEKKPPENATSVSRWRVEKEHPEIGKAGLFFDAWRNGFGGWWPGSTFPTPCSDGESVYVATAWRQYACFGFDGTLKWMQWFPQGGGKNDKANMRGDSGDGCGGCRSPLVWGDLFIADTFGWVRALDRKTGKVAWEVSRGSLGIGNHEVASPVVMTIGGVDVMWCNGPLAIRLPDGKPLKIEGWDNTGMMVVLNTDERDTIFMTGGGEHGGWTDKGKGSNPPPAAIQFTIAGDSLKAKVLWIGVEGKGRASNCATLAYHDGKVFYYNGIGVWLDPKTGKVLKGVAEGKGGGARAIPATGSMYAIAGNHIYGSGSGGEHGCEKRNDGEPAKVIMEVYDLAGKPVAVNTLYGPKLEGEFLAMHRAAQIPNWFSYSMPFTVGGDRIYVRGCYQLYCIGAK